jgi:hypothetical protein
MGFGDRQRDLVQISTLLFPNWITLGGSASHV